MKVFVGPRLRRLREDRGFTQVEVARKLELSASYYNQIENDERPLTAALIGRISELFAVDAQLFSGEQEARLMSDMRDALAASAPGEPVTLAELHEVASRSPGLARALVAIERRQRAALERVALLAQRAGEAGDAAASPLALTPYEEVRDFFYARHNYLDEIDRAAERITIEAGVEPGNALPGLTHRLEQRHGVTLVLDRGEQTASDLVERRYQARERRLYLSRYLDPGQRAFQIATQLALLEAGPMIDRLAHEGDFASDEARALARIGIAHHFAGALVMPYPAFLAAAEARRYDIDRLCQDFAVGYEMACHRLSTLQRAGAEGVPFFFLRVDRAGNISKRQSATDFHFSRVGGTCPLWNVYEAFSQPGRVLTQLAEMPDGRRYLWIARTVSRSYGGYGSAQKTFAIALGCDVRHARRLVYSQGIDFDDPAAFTPIGMGCRVCERPECPQRAFPPLAHKLEVDPNQSHFVPYSDGK